MPIRAFLALRWFLLALAGGGLAALGRPEWFAWTRPIDPRLVVAVALLLTAWTLPSRSLARVLAQPWPAFWAVCFSYYAGAKEPHPNPKR